MGASLWSEYYWFFPNRCQIHKIQLHQGMFLDCSDYEYVFICCDGLSFGNPGGTGFGIITMDHAYQVIGTMSGGICTSKNYIDDIAETFAVICALEWASVLIVKKVILRSCSKSVINDFCWNNILWALRKIWLNAKQILERIVLQHIIREENFCVDDLAKRGAVLGAGERIMHTLRTIFSKVLKCLMYFIISFVLKVLHFWVCCF